MVLYVNACVREKSRTGNIAEYLLSKLDDEFITHVLSEIVFPFVDEAFLNKRDKMISKRDFDSCIFDYANDFAKADTIVIAAPYWDLSFPSSLKQYFEQINVIGITFDYTDNGKCFSLCKAKKLYYVTTCGGEGLSFDFGFGYIKALCDYFYGVPYVKMFKAEGLDIFNADIAMIIDKCKNEIDKEFE